MIALKLNKQESHLRVVGRKNYINHQTKSDPIENVRFVDFNEGICSERPKE